jgi:hypothetical protein
MASLRVITDLVPSLHSIPLWQWAILLRSFSQLSLYNERFMGGHLKTTILSVYKQLGRGDKYRLYEDSKKMAGFSQKNLYFLSIYLYFY